MTDLALGAKCGCNGAASASLSSSDSNAPPIMPPETDEKKSRRARWVALVDILKLRRVHQRAADVGECLLVEDIGLGFVAEVSFPIRFQLVEGRGGELQFSLGRRARKGEPMGASELGGFVAGFRENALGEVTGDLVHGGIVQKMKRLRGHGGLRALDAVGLHARQVEGGEEGRHLGAALLHVNGPPPAVCAARNAYEPVGTALDAVGFAAAIFFIQLSGDKQERIAQRLGIELGEQHAREQGVVGITLRMAFGNVADLLVRGGGHDQPVHGLEAPVSSGEFRGQPVEQLRM